MPDFADRTRIMAVGDGYMKAEFRFNGDDWLCSGESLKLTFYYLIYANPVGGMPVSLSLFMCP